MPYDITLIPGDGTGPEIAEVSQRCIEATGVPIRWDIQPAGLTTMATHGTPLPDAVLESIRRNKVALKSPITTPIGTGFRSVNVALRHQLDLYACLRPCKSYAGVQSRYTDIDITFVRENTEDLYLGVEYESGKPETRALIEKASADSKKKIDPESGISIKPISPRASARIVKYAFEFAKSHAGQGRYASVNKGRRKITAVHKANIQKFSDGLFLRVAREVAQSYGVKVKQSDDKQVIWYEGGEVEFEDRIVDNMCMQLVQKPELYDLLVLPNLYGDILSDLGAGLVGGLGVAPGANIGDTASLFEATHGSAPKYAGQDKVNPCAVILSGVLMLHHIGEHDAAERLEHAVADTIREGRVVTYDLKKDRNDPTAAKMSEMGAEICRKLTKGAKGKAAVGGGAKPAASKAKAKAKARK